MIRTFTKLTSCILAVVMMLTVCVCAFAADKNTTRPIVVVNGIEANPIIDSTDGTVLFDAGMLMPKLYFASGFPDNFDELFSAEVIKDLTSGDKEAMDIVNTLAEYLGFSGDITAITNKLIEVVTPILAGMEIDMDNLDIGAIISGIDWNQILKDAIHKVEDIENNAKRIRLKPDGTPQDKKTTGIPATGNADQLFDEYPDAAEIALGSLGGAIADMTDYETTYIFTYDWRISPVKNASLLNKFIRNVVIKESGSRKVDLISEGYGSTIACTYLSKYSNSVIEDFVTVSSGFEGTTLAADIYTGNLPDPVFGIESYAQALVRYINDRSDNPLTGGAAWIAVYTLYREWQIQELAIKAARIVNNVASSDTFAFIYEFLRYCPGLWALVPEEYYEDALAYMYSESDGEQIDEKLVKQLDEFKDIQAKGGDILLDAQDAGVNVSVVALWNVQMLPVGADCGHQSDGWFDTSYQSFGATCVDLNQVAEGMAVIQQEDTDHDHLSNSFDALDPFAQYAGRCHYIDASTCALPENTWFIYNMKHGTWDPDSNSIDFILWLLQSGRHTVWDEAAYPQFIQYNRFVNPGVLSNYGYTYTDSGIPGKYLWGDVDLDGSVTTADAAQAYGAAAGSPRLDPESVAFANADVNRDGAIDDYDALGILAAAGGLDPEHRGGIKTDYLTERGKLKKTASRIKIERYYNSLKNTFAMRISLTEAAGLRDGAFVIDYDSGVLTLTDCEPNTAAGSAILAGKIADGKLGVCIAGAKPVPASQCNEDGSLTLAVFRFRCPKDNMGDRIQITEPVAIGAGSTGAYISDGKVFIKPVELTLSPSEFLFVGDADGDGQILAKDARYVLRMSARLEPTATGDDFIRCDADGDGVITAADARFILRASAGLINTYVDHGF